MATKIKHKNSSSCFSRSEVKGKDLKGQPFGRNFYLKNSDVNFRKLMSCSATNPRKGMPTRPQRLNQEDSVILKRGSLYLSSSEVRRARKLKEGRGMNSANNNDAFVSYEIADSSSWIRRDDAVLVYEKSGSSLGSSNAELKSQSVDFTLPEISREFLELSFCELPGKRLNRSLSCSGRVLENNSSVEIPSKFCPHTEETELPCAEEASRPVTLVDKGRNKETNSNCNKMPGPEIDGHIIYGRNFMHTLPKSFPPKTGMTGSHSQSEKEILKPTPKMRFSPMKRMFAIMKSKSLWSPSLTEAEMAGRTATNVESISRDGSFHKSLLNDFSKTSQKMEYDGRLTVRDQVSSMASSPANLHGILKFEFKHGAPTFEFVVQDPEDILSAKAWSTDRKTNCAYTFYRCKKKGYRAGWRAKDRHLHSLAIIGQLQVSCFMCSELCENGSLDNYMATESILYDITQARRGISIEERSHFPSYSIQPPTVTVSESLVTESSLVTHSSVETEHDQHYVRHYFTGCDSDPSTYYPLSLEDLHPHLEIAATLIQIPFNRGSLKVVETEKIGSDGHSNVSSFSFNNGRGANSNCLNPAVVKVVIPSGTHGLPTTVEGGPSSLLDRWTFGGGCDCGGWDMACPLIVLDNACGNLFGNSMVGNQQPMLLFFQGRNDKIPALSITADGEGRYSVHFHAQLSAVQAFSICVAIIHSSEASAAADQEKNKHRLYSNSLKLVLDKEVKNSIEAVAEEKINAKKKVVQTPAVFVLDLPFSPRGRV